MYKLLIPVASGLLALISIAVAFAHAEPVRVSPGANAILKASPSEIMIQMSQDMARQQGMNDIVVQNSSGTEVTQQPATIDNGDRSKISVPVPPNLPAGEYTVRWRTLSADDGDKASGNYTFKVDPNGTASPGTEVVRPELLGSQTATAGGGNSAAASGAGETSIPWVLLVSTAVGMFVLGAGTSFLLVQKRG